MTKSILIENIPSRDIKRGGVVHPGKPSVGHHALIVVGESIRLYGRQVRSMRVENANGTYSYPNVECPYSRTFKVGDVAEYDSFNLSYCGRITAIGEKTVTVVDDSRGNRGKTTRLSIHEFSWRNRDLDLEKVAARNSDVMSTC